MASVCPVPPRLQEEAETFEGVVRTDRVDWRASISAGIAICEANHMPSSAQALLVGQSAARAAPMKTRRMMYWWFRFVVSGRFIETFFNLRRVKRS
jgi:hypothetical protein